MAKSTAVYGILHSRVQLERATESLRLNGFRPEDISVLLPESAGRDIVTEKTSKGPEGTATGGVTGAAAGAMLGWLAGVGVLAIPGVGPFIAAGPIMATMAGMGAGAVLGGAAGGLVGIGIPEYESKHYEGFVQQGGILISVHCATHEATELAKQVLDTVNAEAIASTGEASTYFDKPVPHV